MQVVFSWSLKVITPVLLSKCACLEDRCVRDFRIYRLEWQVQGELFHITCNNKSQPNLTSFNPFSKHVIWWWYWCRCLILRIAGVEIARITCWYTPESHFCSILWRCLNLQRESHEKLKLQYGLSMSIRKTYEVLCSLFDLQCQSTHFITRMSYKKWLREFQQQIPKRCNCKKSKNKSM